MRHVKIYENLLVTKIIGYNWDKVSTWVKAYSMLSMLNLIFFIFRLYFWVIPFQTLQCLVYGLK